MIHDATPRARAMAAVAILAGVTVAPACGGPSQANPDGGGTGSPDARADGGGTPKHDGGARSDGGVTASCVPTLASVAWKSPYEGWSRGIPTDPSFFPIAVWLQGSWHATELAGLGVNIYVGNNGGTDPLAASDLATLKSLGLRAIIGQDSVGLASIDDPTIVGWWMTPDEPDNAQPNGSGGYGPPVAPAALAKTYAAYKAKDPTRPIWLGLGQGVAYDGWEGRGSGAPPESGYVTAGDIVAFDIYPYNNCGGDANEMATCGQFWLNAFGVDRLRTWSDRHQAVWSDFETTIIGAGTTTGPTPTQTISEVWLALIHGANGITYFIDSWNPSFREDAIFESPTMVTAVTALNKQIQSLAPVLNSATRTGLVNVKSSSATAPIDVLVKAKGETLYVFSAVSRKGTTTGTFQVVGMTGSASAVVLGEGRTVSVTDGKFSDSFADNGVHIYTIDLSTAKCPAGKAR